MSERVYKLLNGSELLVSEEVMGVRQSPEGMPITVDGDYVIDDVLALVDVGNEAARELEYAKKQAGIWNDEAVRLRKELEEAWTTIRHYGIALMAAKNLSKEIDHTGTPKDTFTFRSIAKNMKILMSLVDWKAIDSLTVGQEGEGTMSQTKLVFRQRMDMDYAEQECPKCNHAYQIGGERLLSLPYCGACGKTVLDLNHKYCGWCGEGITDDH